METSAPMAKSEKFDLPYIGKEKIKNMQEIVGKSIGEKQNLMADVFDSLKKGTTFQVIEENQNNEDGTDVILRQDTGSGGGIRGPRFPHGTPVELVPTLGRVNKNGYSFRTMRDSKGQERIYVHVRANGQEGYMAMEHIGIKNIPVDIASTPPVVPLVEEPKPTAEPTVDETKKSEEPKPTAEPTVDETKKSEESKPTAEPTTETIVDEDKKSETAEPTENPDEAGKRIAEELLASVLTNQNKEEVSKKIGPELISTLNTLNLDQDKQNSINELLIDQNFNLVLDSGTDLKDFTFDGINITNEKLGTQQITNIEVSGTMLIVTLKNETSLIFAPPKG